MAHSFLQTRMNSSPRKQWHNRLCDTTCYLKEALRGARGCLVHLYKRKGNMHCWTTIVVNYATPLPEKYRSPELCSTEELTVSFRAWWILFTLGLACVSDGRGTIDNQRNSIYAWHRIKEMLDSKNRTFHGFVRVLKASNIVNHTFMPRKDALSSNRVNPQWFMKVLWEGKGSSFLQVTKNQK